MASLCYQSVSSLPASTSLSHTAAPQSLVMSPGGVANDNSVTLTLTDTQGMLDGVTLNLNAQVIEWQRTCCWSLVAKQLFGSWTSSPLNLFSNDFHLQGQTFPAVLNDSGLSAQSNGSGQQVILVSHSSQATNGASDNGYSVSVLMLLHQTGQSVWLVGQQYLFLKFDWGAVAAADGDMWVCDM